MDAEAGRTTTDVQVFAMKVQRALHAALFCFFVLLITVVVLIVLLVGASESGDDGGSSASSAVVYEVDESEYDDGSDTDSLDCTPSGQTWYLDVVPTAPFYMQEICDGLYAYGDGFYGGMLLVTSSGVIFVDAPPSMYYSLPYVAAQVTDNPITTVIYSHHHIDHIGAAAVIPGIETAEVVCHSWAEANLYDGAPNCTTIIDLETSDDAYIVADGDQYMILRHPSYTAHTNGDFYIFAPRQRTIMTVDLVYPKWAPFKHLGMTDDPEGWYAAHDFLLSIRSSIYGDWENLVAGHVDQLGDRDDVEVSKEYYTDIQECIEHIEANDTYSFVSVIYNQFSGSITASNKWDIVKAYQMGVAEECARMMVDDLGWGDRIHGLEAYGVDNCYWVFEDGHINIA